MLHELDSTVPSSIVRDSWAVVLEWQMRMVQDQPTFFISALIFCFCMYCTYTILIYIARQPNQVRMGENLQITGRFGDEEIGTESTARMLFKKKKILSIIEGQVSSWGIICIEIGPNWARSCH